MTEAEALRYFLKLICVGCVIWIAFAWLILALLYRRIRLRRAARSQALAIPVAK